MQLTTQDIISCTSRKTKGTLPKAASLLLYCPCVDQFSTGQPFCQPMLLIQRYGAPPWLISKA